MTDDEIIQRLKDLWINNTIHYGNNSESPTYNEESSGYEETTSEEMSSWGEYSSSTSEWVEVR
jgi:hypothetical protein